MTEPTYFQWQNDTLLKTIYPRRLEKLCDFLVHYREIDLWQENKGMPPETFEQARKTYEVKQAKVLVDMVRVYNEQREYFLENDGKSAYFAKYRDLKDDERERVEKLHGAFQVLKLDIYKGDVRKEKIFVSQRVSAWEEYRKKVNDLIFRQRRRVSIANANLKEAEKTASDRRKTELQAVVAAEKAEMNRLESQLMPMVEEELTRLNALSSSYNKIEKRKLALKKARAKLEVDREKRIADLEKFWRGFRRTEDDLRAVQGWLRRFKERPDLDRSQKAVLADVDWGSVGQVFGAETRLLDRVRGIREYLVGLLKNTHGFDVKLTFVMKMMENLGAVKADIDGRIGRIEISGGQKELLPVLQAIQSQVLLPELERLADFQFVLDQKVHTRTDDMLARLWEANQGREREVRKKIEEGQASLLRLQAELASVQAELSVDGDNELVKFVPEKPVTVNDIVTDMANVYRASLANKTHTELLEEIVQLFWSKPERFPSWLQYMVIHFSGMRYASAHGSWADPKELLINLRSSMRENEYRKLIDEDDVKAKCEERIRVYEVPDAQPVVEGEEPPKFARSQVPSDREKIDVFIEKLNSDNYYVKRKALFDLKAEEDKYEIEAMQPSEVLERLRDINEKENLPAWMWNEIVAMTELRIREAKDPNWEKLTPEQEVEKNSGRWEKFRAIMNQWKSVNLTGWRKEHEDTGQLIVTRAVCNEVAEHIQHMRGHEGAAGLTEKPNWYKREEREFDKTWPAWTGERPYFKRPRQVMDFKQGASILWLRYVRDFPNEWRIAQPLETKEGDGLIRAEYLGRRAPGNWTYRIDNGIPRSRKGPKGTEVQYLRWMHEATVAEVAETADGPVVLTFETALPYEDRRLSTIGVFKRDPDDLMHDQGEEGYNPAFVGFVPEGEIPAAHLKDMLDWNKILRRPFKTEAELKAYQDKYIRRRSALPQKSLEKPGGVTVSGISKVEKPKVMAPVEKKNLYRALNWGHPTLVAQAGLSAMTRHDSGQVVGSNFNPLPLYSNGDTWSAIVNALIIPREDIDRLIALQVVDHFTIREKMNWLVYEGNDERPYWCKGTGDWETAAEVWWGTIVFGGQLVLADGDASFFTKLPQETEARDVPMKRLVCFRKADWGRTHDTHPWLIHKATQVDQKDRYTDEPRGFIYSPLWSPLDWDFAGGRQPEAFYLPADWLEPFEKGLARDFVGQVQSLRKKAGLKPKDRVELFIDASPEMRSAIAAYEQYVTDETLAVRLVHGRLPGGIPAFKTLIYGNRVTAGLVRK